MELTEQDLAAENERLREAVVLLRNHVRIHWPDDMISYGDLVRQGERLLRETAWVENAD